MSITGDVAAGQTEAGRASAVTQALAGLAPGPAMLAYLCSLDPARLDGFERVEVLKAWERQHAWLMAYTNQAILAVAGTPPRDDDDDDWQRDEVAAALNISGRAAAHRIHQARTLDRCLPRTRAALAAGTINWRHALTLLDETLQLPDDAVRAVETAVIDRAPTQNPAQFTRAVRRAVIATAPVHAELAHEIARTDRRVWLQPEPDGMATLAALLPAAQARRGVFKRLTWYFLTRYTAIRLGP